MIMNVMIILVEAKNPGNPISHHYDVIEYSCTTTGDTYT